MCELTMDSNYHLNLLIEQIRGLFFEYIFYTLIPKALLFNNLLRNANWKQWLTIGIVCYGMELK
jgi:hypothetical protein